MKNAEIKTIAERIEAENDFGDFCIGSITMEPLPNGKASTLVCVDCSWLRTGSRMGDQEPILDINELDQVVGEEPPCNPTITLESDDIKLVSWVDLVDNDGDVHHCKVVHYQTVDLDNWRHPLLNYDNSDYVLYVEL